MTIICISQAVSSTAPSLTHMIVEAVVFGFLLLIGYAIVGALTVYSFFFSPASAVTAFLTLLLICVIFGLTFLFFRMLKKIRKHKKALRAQKQPATQ